MKPEERASLIYSRLRTVRQAGPGFWLLGEEELLQLLIAFDMTRGIRPDPPHVPQGPHTEGMP